PARFFSNLRGIEELIFTKRIVSIGDNAFEGVRGLSTIKNIEHAESIGDYAFAHSEIEHIKLSPKTKYMGVGIFAGCEKILHIEMPLRFIYAGALFDSMNQNSTKKVIQVNGNVEKEFYIPESLDTIVINDGTLPNGVFSGMNINIEVACEMKNISNYAFNGCKEVVFSHPDKIETIGAYAFSNSVLGEMIFDNVATIDEYAFSNSQMVSLKIGNKLTDFHNTTLIDAVVDDLSIVETDDFLTLNEMLVDIKKGAIVHVNNISGEITIPDQVHTLNSNTFVNCNELTKVNTNKVKTISQNTFVNCEKLEGLVVDVNVDTIEGEIFKNCPSIDSLYLTFLGLNRETGKDIGYLFERMEVNRAFKNITITEGLICTEPFRNCSSIETLDLQKVEIVKMESGLFRNLNINTLVIPDSTTSIKEYAFDNTRISNLINRSNKNVSVSDGCIYAENKLIYCCAEESPKIAIPKTTKEILPGAFQICHTITNLEIENDSIKFNNSFKDVTKLNTITIGKVKGLLSEIFTTAITTIDVINYKGVDFNEGFLNGLCDLITLNVLNLKSLKTSMLTKRDELLKISFLNMGAALNELDAEALRLCSIDHVNIVKNEFYSSPANMVIDNRNSSIIFAANQISEKIVIEHNVKKIADKAFKNNSKLTHMNTGKIQEIGNEAFMGCENLKDINITNMCNVIGENIIKKCENLEIISIPFIGSSINKTEKISSLVELDRALPIKVISITNQAIIDGTFAYAKNILRVSFGDATTTINANSFNSCADIKEISIPATTKNVGEFVFFNCKRKITAFVYSRKATESWSKDWKKVKAGNFFSSIKVSYSVDEV
ncbi:MAG: leucine-rich repeat protein, partial [bacterium]